MKTRIRNFFSNAAKWQLFIYANIITFIIFFGVIKFPVTFQQLELIKNKLFDYQMKFHLTEKKFNTKDVLIIAIDEKSLSKLGQFSQWPNAYFADLVDFLTDAKVKAIGFDILFPESDSLTSFTKKYYEKRFSDIELSNSQMNSIFRQMSSDTKFSESIKKSKKVYLAMFDDLKKNNEIKSFPKNLQAYPKYKNLKPTPLINPRLPTSLLAANTKNLGFAHIHNDSDGVIRFFPIFFSYNEKLYTNFSSQIVFNEFSKNILANDKFLTLNDSLQIPLHKNNKFLLHYYGKKKSFRYLSFSDVLRKRIPKRFFNDKIVLIGASAFGLEDLKTTTIDKAVPGVEIHATFIQNIINKDFIYPLNSWQNISLYILLYLLVTSLWIYPKVRIIFVAFLFGIIPLLVSGFFFLDKFSVYINVVTLLLFFTIFFVVSLFTLFSQQLKEKAQIRNTFEKYVSQTLVNQLLKDPSKIRSGGDFKEIAVMFTDIKDFTSLCEKLDPQEVSSFLTYYLTTCTQTIIDNLGFLDKYIGDAIVAIFGAPINYNNYEIKACLTALKIVEINNEIRKSFSDHKEFSKIYTRIGISTGSLIVGNLGSNQIYDYTAIGDVMNLGARLEGLNKFYKTEILINEKTFKALPKTFLCRQIDVVKVKGKDIGENIFELIDFSESAKFSKEKTLKKEIYDSAFEYYQKKEMVTSYNILKSYLEIHDDLPAQHLLERIAQFSDEDLDNFDGIWKMLEK